MLFQALQVSRLRTAYQILIYVCLLQRESYFFSLNAVWEWLLLASSLAYVTPFLTGHPFHWQFELGSLALFLAWFKSLLFLQE